MKHYLVLNMKAYQTSGADIQKTFKKIATLQAEHKINTIVCPPMPMIGIAGQVLPKRKTLQLGAQDAYYENEGAYTGMSTPALLQSLKASHVILGHSERRALGETNADVNKKIHAVLKTGMTPIVCVGEKTRDDAGNYLQALREQIVETFAHVSREQFSQLMIAYEPVWAIGKNAVRSATPDEAVEMALYIRKVLHDACNVVDHADVTILYGGSVHSGNAQSFISQQQIDGLLVGRASVDAKELPGIFSAFK